MWKNESKNQILFSFTSRHPRKASRMNYMSESQFYEYQISLGWHSDLAGLQPVPPQTQLTLIYHLTRSTEAHVFCEVLELILAASMLLGCLQLSEKTRMATNDNLQVTAHYRSAMRTAQPLGRTFCSSLQMTRRMCNVLQAFSYNLSIAANKRCHASALTQAQLYVWPPLVSVLALDSDFNSCLRYIPLHYVPVAKCHT